MLERKNRCKSNLKSRLLRSRFFGGVQSQGFVRCFLAFLRLFSLLHKLALKSLVLLENGHHCLLEPSFGVQLFLLLGKLLLDFFGYLQHLNFIL